MVSISIDYQGELRCQARHDPSGTLLITDAPADNHGKAESFSPTDLVATALGTCILTTMAIKADSMGIELKGARASVEKEMAAAPRRIGALRVEITLPLNLPEKDRIILERTAHTCPVHKSMAETVDMPITFRWG